MFKRTVPGAWAILLVAMHLPSAFAQAAPKTGRTAKQQVLVVLEFTSRPAGTEVPGVDAAALSKTVRAAATSTRPDLAVLEREPMLKALRGRTLSESGCKEPCEVALGKFAAADLVLSGTLSRAAASTTLILALYDVGTGAAVGTETVTVKRAKNLEGNLSRLTGLLLSRLGAQPAADGAFAQPSQVPAAAQGQTAPAPTPAAAPAGRTPLSGSKPLPEIAPLPPLLHPKASFPFDTSPDALVARELALAADERGASNPTEAVKAWKALVEVPQVNPFKDVAQTRARQWTEFRAQKEAFERQKEDDKHSVRKVLPLRSVADVVKVELLLRFSKLYGVQDARELLPAIDQASARASAEGALGCEAKDGQACVSGARAAVETGDKARANELWEKGCAAGAPEACEEVGTALADAEGAGRDLVRATAALKLACEAGRGRACSKLATAAVVGKEGTPDAKLLEKGCVAGDGHSCMRLGLMIENGKIAGDIPRAIAFFRLGCKFNDAGACSKFNAYQQRAEAEATARAYEEEAIRKREEAARAKQAREAEGRASRRTASVVLLAAGLAAGVGAGAFLYLGASNNDGVRQGPFATGQDLQSAIDTGKTYNLVAMVAGGVGVAALGTGLALFLLNPTPDTKVALLPNGLTFAARF